MSKDINLRERSLTDQSAEIVHFSLQDLLAPNRLFVVNTEVRVVSLLADGPLIIKQQQLTENELRVLMPILKAFPLNCPYDLLLASVFAPKVTPSALAYWQRRLGEARSDGIWQQELRPLRRILSSLRSKLQCFQLEISTAREIGCSLTSLKALPVGC